MRLVSLSPSTAKRMAEQYARKQPTMIALLMLGLDILIKELLGQLQTDINIIKGNKSNNNGMNSF